jgi:hypothetical protein
LGCSLSEMKKLKLVTRILHIFIDLQELMANCLNLSPSLSSTILKSPSPRNTQTIQQWREYPISTHFQDPITFMAHDTCLPYWKIKFSNKTLWHEVDSCAGNCHRDSIVPESWLLCIWLATSWESSRQVGPRAQPGHILTENYNSQSFTRLRPLCGPAELETLWVGHFRVQPSYRCVVLTGGSFFRCHLSVRSADRWHSVLDYYWSGILRFRFNCLQITRS